MRIFSKGKVAQIQTICRECGCWFSFTEGEAELVLDQRCSWYYRVLCPQYKCSHPNKVRKDTVPALKQP